MSQDPRTMATNEAILVMMMRLYDIGLGLLEEENEEKAEALYELHKAGGFLAPDIIVTTGSDLNTQEQ